MNNSANSTSNDVKEDGKAPEDEAGDQFPPDAELAKRAGEGDVDAFSVLLKRYQNSVYAILYNLSQKAEIADDLTQQTFVKVWSALPGFEHRSSFYTWLYRIAHNVFYDHARKREPLMEDIHGETFRQDTIDPSAFTANSQSTSPDEALMTRERIALFRQAVQKLSEEHRSVLLLKEVNGLSYKEIAEIMDCSVGTVMSRLHYARQNLRTILHDYDN